jgi:hypothetical protein
VGELLSFAGNGSDWIGMGIDRIGVREDLVPSRNYYMARHSFEAFLSHEARR